MDYGKVIFEGKEYTLTEEAYVNNYGTDGDVRYYASAEDEEGNKYKVTWETTGKYDAACRLAVLEAITERSDEEEEEIKELCEKYDFELGDYGNLLNDESEACDWDDPCAVELID